MGTTDSHVTGGGKLVSIDGLDSHLFHGSNRGEYL